MANTLKIRQKLFGLLIVLALVLLLKDLAPTVTRLAGVITNRDAGGTPVEQAMLRAPSAGDPSGLAVPAAAPGSEPTALALLVATVVRVTGPAFAGSGVVIDPSGAVLTSAHVVGDAAEVSVVVEDSQHLTARVVRTDVKRDLALLQLPKGAYSWASLAGGAAPALGSAAVVIGYPLGLPGPATVTTGVVSRLIREPDLGRTLLQTDAAINLGNSGGPILDHRGAVIGIVASVMGEYQSIPARGISFAVAAETILQEFLDGSVQP